MDNRPYIEATIEQALCELKKAGVAPYVIAAFTAETVEDDGRVYLLPDVPDIPGKDGKRLERCGLLYAVAKRYLAHYGEGTELERCLADEWRQLEREAVFTETAAIDRKRQSSKGGQQKKGHEGALKQLIRRFIEAEDPEAPMTSAVLLEAMRAEAERNSDPEGPPVGPLQVLSVTESDATYLDAKGGEEEAKLKTIQNALSEIRNPK